MKKRCRYGKLKHRVGHRVCKKARRTKARRSRTRRPRRSFIRRHGPKAAGMSLGLLAVMGLGAVGAIKYWQSVEAVPETGPGSNPGDWSNYKFS